MAIIPRLAPKATGSAISPTKKSLIPRLTEKPVAPTKQAGSPMKVDEKGRAVFGVGQGFAENSQAVAMARGFGPVRKEVADQLVEPIREITRQEITAPSEKKKGGVGGAATSVARFVPRVVASVFTGDKPYLPQSGLTRFFLGADEIVPEETAKMILTIPQSVMRTVVATLANDKPWTPKTAEERLFFGDAPINPFNKRIEAAGEAVSKFRGEKKLGLGSLFIGSIGVGAEAILNTFLDGAGAKKIAEAAAKKTYTEIIEGLARQAEKDLAPELFQTVAREVAEASTLKSAEVRRVALEQLKKKYLRAATPVPAFGGFKDLSTKIIESLKGKTTVSKQFISDLTNQGNIKQAERDIIRRLLESEGNTINATEFANKVKTELLPLSRKQIAERYENIGLPDELRGPVANYQEHIYNSPIKTSAGSVHFGGEYADEGAGYFAHTRVEDLPATGKSAPKYTGNDPEILKAMQEYAGQGSTRRVIELQSDLFQKGGLGKEAASRELFKPGESVIYKGKPQEVITSTGGRQFVQLKGVQGDIPVSEITRSPQITAGLDKLEPYRNTWQERIIREEVKQAAKDGKTTLQFPTGETAMKIEGLGESSRWLVPDTRRGEGIMRLAISGDEKVGTQIRSATGQGEWIITDVLGDGKFKAVAKDRVDEAMSEVGKNRTMAQAIQDIQRRFPSWQETFDISGKVDQNNPIYKFYEKEVAKFLRNKYNAKLVTDAQGITWNEVRITPEMKKAPVEAFGAVAGFGVEEDEKGKPKLVFDPVKGGFGLVGGALLKQKLPETIYAANRAKEIGESGIKAMLKGVGKNIKTALSETGKTLDKVLGTASTRLKNIDPSLKVALRNFEYRIANVVQKDRKAAEGWLRGTYKLTDAEYADLDLALKNGDAAKIEDIVKRNGLEEEYGKIRTVLDDLYNRASDVGYDIGYEQNYFPRVVNDSEGLLAYLEQGDDWSIIDQAIKKRETEVGRYLTVEEKANLVNTMIRGYGQGKITLSKTGAMKARAIDVVDAELNQFYKDSGDALLTYIDSTNDAIEGRIFFGKQFKKFTSVNGELEEFGNIEDSIGSYVMDLLAQGKIKPSQEKELRDILQARFSQVGTSGAIRIYKNLSYIDTMGSITSAITQIGDLAFALYKAGPIETIKALGRAVAGKSKITRADIGIEKIAQEFEGASRSAKAVDATFKLIGLQKMDALGKETLINAVISKMRRQALKPSSEFIRKLKATLGEDANVLEVINDLKAGRTTENVKMIAFNELLDVQPVALSEMPEQYLKGGNGRIFYMLKTYTIKLFDVYRNEVFQVMKTDPIKGIRNLLALSAALVAMNATADEIKDFILGRKTSLKDRTVDNILKLAGFNKFTIYKAREEGIGSATAKTILPPFKLIDSLYKDITQANEVAQSETVQSIPFGGKLYYWWFGKGRTKTEKKQAQEDETIGLPSFDDLDLPTLESDLPELPSLEL